MPLFVDAWVAVSTCAEERHRERVSRAVILSGLHMLITTEVLQPLTAHVGHGSWYVPLLCLLPPPKHTPLRLRKSLLVPGVHHPVLVRRLASHVKLTSDQAAEVMAIATWIERGDESRVKSLQLDLRCPSHHCHTVFLFGVSELMRSVGTKPAQLLGPSLKSVWAVLESLPPDAHGIVAAHRARAFDCTTSYEEIARDNVVQEFMDGVRFVDYPPSFHSVPRRTWVSCAVAGICCNRSPPAPVMHLLTL